MYANRFFKTEIFFWLENYHKRTINVSHWYALPTATGKKEPKMALITAGPCMASASIEGSRFKCACKAGSSITAGVGDVDSLAQTASTCYLSMLIIVRLLLMKYTNVKHC